MQGLPRLLAATAVAMSAAATLADIILHARSGALGASVPHLLPADLIVAVTFPVVGGLLMWRWSSPGLVESCCWIPCHST
jgi:hypothetical protein